MVMHTKDEQYQSKYIDELLRSHEARARLEEARPAIESLGLRVEQARIILEKSRNITEEPDEGIELAQRRLEESIGTLVAYLEEVVR